MGAEISFGINPIHVHHLIQKNHDFWNHERSLTALLTYMVISLFVWIPFADYSHGWWGFLLSELIFNLIILAGLFSVLTRWRKQLFFIAIALLASAFRILSFLTETNWSRELSYVLAIVFFVLLAQKVREHIFKDGPVNFYRVQGSVVIFLIIGIVYAWVYTLVEALLPGSFSSVVSSAQHPTLFSQFLYFSFVTMSTLGYGDLIPTGALAKSLVIFQGIIGLLYPVVLIARLVSMEVTHTMQNKR